MTSMRIIKTIFFLVGCVGPAFVGTAHLFAHFKSLITDEVFSRLDKNIDVIGNSQNMWEIWGMTSFMMGICFIILGLYNGAMLYQLEKKKSIPIVYILLMICYQLSVTTVGYVYNQSFQLYGGTIGTILLLICLFFSFKQYKK